MAKIKQKFVTRVPNSRRVLEPMANRAERALKECFANIALTLRHGEERVTTYGITDCIAGLGHDGLDPETLRETTIKIVYGPDDEDCMTAIAVVDQPNRVLSWRDKELLSALTVEELQDEIERRRDT